MLNLQRAQIVRAICDLISASDELADDEQIEAAVGLLRELFAAYYGRDCDGRGGAS